MRRCSGRNPFNKPTYETHNHETHAHTHHRPRPQFAFALFADEPFPDEPIHYTAFTLRSVPVGKDGKVNALIMTPDKPLPGNPWVLGTFQDVRNAAVANMTRTQLELVRRGFHVVGASPGVVLGDWRT